MSKRNNKTQKNKTNIQIVYHIKRFTLFAINEPAENKSKLPAITIANPTKIQRQTKIQERKKPKKSLI
jgi:hypothetical protein